MNSPGSLGALYRVATNSATESDQAGDVPRPIAPRMAAELIREVGLKCISFNGIPRTINGLGQFRTQLPPDVASSLATTPTRALTEQNIRQTGERGLALWNSVYAPFEKKLIDKLTDSHPDLPVYILGSHYGPLLSDPPERYGLASVGRALTSVVAISCLRAQTGVGPQVLSHVFGLRKGVEDGTYRTADAEEIEGVEWLASDKGSEWLLHSVDQIVDVVSDGNGSNFAATDKVLHHDGEGERSSFQPTRESKL
jgi:hypothetical protein